MRLEMETRKLEDVVDQTIIKNCGARKFSLFGLRLAIWKIEKKLNISMYKSDEFQSEHHLPNIFNKPDSDFVS